MDHAVEPARASKPGEQALTGILLMSTGVACLCINDAFAKTLTESYSPVQIFFLRNLIAMPFAVLCVLLTGGRGALRSRRPAPHFLRGALWLFATVLFFSGLKHLELAEATALVFVAPIFITALSAIILREQVGWRRWSAVLVGFVGAMIVIRPGGDAFQPASLFPLTTALVYACLMIAARWVDPRESVWTLLFYMTGTGLLFSACLAPFFWVAPRGEDLWLFLSVAVFGTAGVTMMTQAFRFAPAAVVAPVDYSALLWATALGWAVWGELPDLATYLGASVIISSGIFIIYRERKAGT